MPCERLSPSEQPKPKVVTDSDSLSFVSLDQLAVDEDAIRLWAESSQKEFSLFLNDDLVLLLNFHYLIRSIAIVASQSERVAQLTPVQNSSLGTIGVRWRTEVE